MSHLNLETLARLVDEAPTALEAAHLAVCEACRGELQDMHVQTAELGGLPELQPPPAQWDAIERRLLAEGMIRRNAPRRVWVHHGLRAAAALALVAAGTLLGRGMNAGPGTAVGPVASTPSAAQPTSGPADPADPAVTLAAAPVEAGPVAEAPAARLVSTESLRAPRSAEEALQQLRAAELSYLDALTRFAELSGSTSAGDPAARLAALEGIVLTTRAALGQAPTDPVINGYHLTALAQRDATLRQIASTSTDSWF